MTTNKESSDPYSRNFLKKLINNLANCFCKKWESKKNNSPEKARKLNNNKSPSNVNLINLLSPENIEKRELNAQDKMMIENLLEFAELRVRDTMIARSEIVAVDKTCSFSEFLSGVNGRVRSRIIVYDKTLDDIKGFIHVKDLIDLIGDGTEKFSIKNLIRPILFVPPSMKTSDLLVKMRKSCINIAAVIDEYGCTEGIITIIDIIEEIVGNITDEYEEEEEIGKKSIVKLSDNKWEICAKNNIYELEEKLSINIVSDNIDDKEIHFDTIAGLILAITRTMPKIGDVIEYKESNLLFEIIDANPRNINRIIVTKIVS